MSEDEVKELIEKTLKEKEQAKAKYKNNIIEWVPEH